MSIFLKAQNRLISIILIGLISAISPLSFADSGVNSYPDFKLSLKKAVIQINNDIAEQQNSKLAKGFSEQEEMGVSGSKGAWKAQLTGYTRVSKKIDASGSLSKSSPITIINNNDRMEYTFILPKMDILYSDYINNKLAIQKNALVKRNKELDVKFSNEESQIKLTAVYIYPENTSSSDTQKHLEDILSDSIVLLSEFVKHSLAAQEGLRKELPKRMLSSLSKDELIILMKDSDFDLSDHEEKSSFSTSGYFKLNYDKNTYHIWNYGDYLEIGISLHIQPFNEMEKQKNIKNKMSNWLKENPAKESSLMKIIDLSPPSETEKQEIAIIAQYKFDGILKGKSLNKYLSTFIKKYGKTVKKRFDKLNN